MFHFLYNVMLYSIEWQDNYSWWIEMKNGKLWNCCMHPVALNPCLSDTWSLFKI